MTAGAVDDCSGEPDRLVPEPHQYGIRRCGPVDDLSLQARDLLSQVTQGRRGGATTLGG